MCLPETTAAHERDPIFLTELKFTSQAIWNVSGLVVALWSTIWGIGKVTLRINVLHGKNFPAA